MKKIFSMILVVLMLVAMVACNSTQTQTPSTSSDATEKPAAQAAATDAATEQPDAAADFPSHAITVIVPWSAGGETDLISRIITEAWSKVLGQSIVIENVTGGSGVIGHTQMLNSAADGYTLMINQLGSTCIQTVMGNTDYTWDEATCIAGVGCFPQCFIVSADSEWETFQDMIDWMKEHPGELLYATQGKGCNGHTNAIDTFQQLGVEGTDIPYENTPASITALLSGEVQCTSCPVNTASKYIDAGQVKLLAMSNEFYIYPDGPTVMDYGCKEGCYSWIGVYGPADMDEAIVNKLVSTLSEAMSDEAVLESLNNFGLDVNFMGAEDSYYYVKLEYDRNYNALVSAGLADPAKAK